MLASNDGGKSWDVLDVRNGETFTERHQRRVFACTNDAAYNVFPLEIDRVNSPSNADAMQLSGNRLMGDPDPTPLFCDEITAQGENEPLETAIAAFDSRADTKWLDFAAAHPDCRSSWVQWLLLEHTAAYHSQL